MSRRVDAERSAVLSAILAKQFPEARPVLLARAIVAAQRTALSAKGTEEGFCNYAYTEADFDRFHARMKRKAVQLAAELAEACSAKSGEIGLRFGGDPRGPCGYLRITQPDGTPNPGDGFGGDGYPLY